MKRVRIELFNSVNTQQFQNRMLDSLQLFHDVANSAFFKEASIILFLNKKDLFAEKIRRVNLNIAFPEFKGKLLQFPNVNFSKIVNRSPTTNLIELFPAHLLFDYFGFSSTLAKFSHHSFHRESSLFCFEFQLRINTRIRSQINNAKFVPTCFIEVTEKLALSFIIVKKQSE